MKGWTTPSALILVLGLSALGAGAAETPAEETGPTSAGKVLPQPISQPPPIFPPSLMRSGTDGVVMVAFTVDESGRVRDPVIENSSSRLLNPYALKAVADWRFSPGTRNGRPAAFRLRAPVEFTGKSEESSRGALAANSRPAPTPTPNPPPPLARPLPPAPVASAPGPRASGVSAVPAGAPAPPTTISPALVAGPRPGSAGIVTATVTAPAARRKPLPVYPYDLLMSGQPGWANASFVVDYVGRPLFTNPAGSSDRAFAMAVVAMVEASAFTPGRKGNAAVMSPSTEHYEFAGESTFDPEAKRILAELRQQRPAILSATDLDERPKVLQQVSPAYPRALKDDGLTGQAEIEFIIDRDGRVLFPRIVSASHEDFGWAAATAVAQWKFQPPQKGGQAVEVKMTVPILFTAQKLAESD